MNINIEFDDQAMRRIEAAQGRAMRLRPLLAATGKRVVGAMRDHFRAREAAGNKHGWPARHFWYGAGPQSVSQHTALASVTDTEAVIVNDDPRLAHKVRGGTITPKRGKYLAIPLREEAYAAGSPRERGVDDLQFVPTKGPGGGGLLVQRAASQISFGRKRKDGTRNVKRKGEIGGLAMYALVPSVLQEADPDALPSEDLLTEAVAGECLKYAARITAKRGAA